MNEFVNTPLAGNEAAPPMRGRMDSIVEHERALCNRLADTWHRVKDIRQKHLGHVPVDDQSEVAIASPEKPDSTTSELMEMQNLAMATIERINIELSHLEEL